MNQAIKILFLSFVSVMSFANEVRTFSEAVSLGLKCTFSVLPKLVTVDSSHPQSLEKIKGKVKFHYCATTVECRGDGFVHSFGLATEGLEESNLECPRRIEDFPVEQKTAGVVCGGAEYKVENHKVQKDKSGIKYFSGVPLMVAHKSEDVEGGWYAHCMIEVKTSKNDKFIAACPWTGNRAFINEKGKKTTMLQCPGPLDCLRKGFKVEEP